MACSQMYSHQNGQQIIHNSSHINFNFNKCFKVSWNVVQQKSIEGIPED